MIITKIETFLFSAGVRVEFLPITDAPGCTHRVYILNNFTVIAKDWFAPTCAIKTPSKKSAKFYYEKHNKKEKVIA